MTKWRPARSSRRESARIRRKFQNRFPNPSRVKMGICVRQFRGRTSVRRCFLCVVVVGTALNNSPPASAPALPPRPSRSRRSRSPLPSPGRRPNPPPAPPQRRPRPRSPPPPRSPRARRPTRRPPPLRGRLWAPHPRNPNRSRTPRRPRMPTRLPARRKRSVPVCSARRRSDDLGKISSVSRSC